MRGQPASPTVDLAKLHDIVLAQPTSYVPQTAGWYVLAVLLVALAAWLAFLLVTHRRRSRYRRDALVELSAIDERLRGTDRAVAFVELDVLLKRVALAAYPREDVAALSGDAWLRFLDRTSGGEQFMAGNGRPLAHLPFVPVEQRASVPLERASALSTACRQWIRSHRVSV